MLNTFSFSYWPFVRLWEKTFSGSLNLFLSHILYGFLDFLFAFEWYEFLILQIITPYQIYGLRTFSLIPQVTFSHCVFFPLLYTSLLIYSPAYLLFTFFACVFGIISEKTIANANVRELFFPSMLSSRNFMVSHYTLTSVIYFELIFLYGVR